LTAPVLTHQPDAVFSKWRDEIEKIASQKYDAGLLDYGMVVITPADLARLIP
jgi:hypothetical protein